jgi:hypothetical protein
MPELDIVPPDLLVPPDAHSRGLDRGDAALVLDGWLRRLAGQEARCRLVLGRLARSFLGSGGQHTLGFARLGDYGRERLGMSARELQSLATVSEGVARLPAIAAAFECGELSWAQLRLLVSVAQPATECEWLALARGRTVRALAALIQEAGKDDEDDGADAEVHVRFRLRCPRRVARLWRHVVELARRMAGADLSQGQAAEAIAAEGLSARPAANTGHGEAGRPDQRVAPADPYETHAAFAEALDWTAVAEAIPEDVERLGRLDDEPDPFALDARMRAVVTAMQRIDWQTGRLLRIFLDRRLWMLMGFSSASRYLRERLGLSERKARALVALERRTWQAPGLGEAYREGALSWVRALVVLPVVGEHTVAAWVARAGEVTVRRLADEVEWALAVGRAGDSAAPPQLGAALEEIERQMCAHHPGAEVPDAEIVFRASASVVSLMRAAIAAFTLPADPPWGGFERLLEHVCAEWEAQPRHPDPVFARDGWRCAVPACSSRRNLHDHHLLFRSRGGDNRRANRVAVCAWHHLRGIHAGRVRAWGEAPHAITWELGVRPGRRPLLRLVGDRYAC